VYGHADVNYIYKDDLDYRKASKDGASKDIDTWTLESGYTGHFNGDVTGTYIGAGSEIVIDGKCYHIMILASGEGEGTIEVTLDHTGVPSGDVHFIGGMYGFKPIPVGKETPAGFLISETTSQASGKIITFEAGQYDL